MNEENSTSSNWHENLIYEIEMNSRLASICKWKQKKSFWKIGNLLHSMHDWFIGDTEIDAVNSILLAAAAAAAATHSLCENRVFLEDLIKTK